MHPQIAQLQAVVWMRLTSVILASAMDYPIIDISDAEPEGGEPMGGKPKFLVRRDGELWLYKYNRSGHGEDWSEKIASQCASLLGLPHAQVEIAVYKHEPGVISRWFIHSPQTQQLVHGNELIVEVVDPGYPHDENFKVAAHTIDRVMTLLKRDDQAIRLPLEWDPPANICSAADLFLGYLLLDALVTNTDRHHANWGIIRYLDRVDSVTRQHLQCLAPTFDHASCLGRELPDKKRRGRLDECHPGFTVVAYTAKPKSRWYLQPDNTQPLNCINAFREAASHCPAVAAHAWLQRLAGIPDHQFGEIVAEVPEERISQVARDFALAMLQSSREILLRDLAQP